MEFVSRKCKDSGYPSIKEMMVLWNPNSSDIEVVQWPPSKFGIKYDKSLMYSWGACNSEIRSLSEERCKLMTMITVSKIIIRDKVDALKVHEAFLNIREYRETCAFDMPNYDGAKYEDINIMD